MGVRDLLLFVLSLDFRGTLLVTSFFCFIISRLLPSLWLKSLVAIECLSGPSYRRTYRQVGESQENSVSLGKAVF